MQNQKRAGLGAERLEEECKGPGSGQCPGSGGQASTCSPGMVGLKKPVVTQSGWAHMPEIPRCCPVGEVPPAVLDLGLTLLPAAKPCAQLAPPSLSSAATCSRLLRSLRRCL